jgi:hypothetical protein
MAAPTAPSTVSLIGDHRGLRVSWEAADETETRFEIQVSLDDGGVWGDSYFVEAGVTSTTVIESDDDKTAKARVRATNGDGDSSWTESASLVIPVAVALSAEDSGTDIVLFVGELMDGLAPAFNAAGFTQESLSGLTISGVPTLNAAAQQVRIKAVNSQATHWGQRWNNLATPFRASVPVTIWNHVGNSIPITAITPNAPSAGSTRITLAGAVQRDVGATFWVRVRGTGLSDMDGIEFEVEVLTSTTLRIAAFTASGSSSTGICDRASLDFYDSDSNGNTNFRAEGTYPSKHYGFESEVLRHFQDKRSEIVGDSTRVSTVGIKLGLQQPLITRAVGSATTARRWSKRLSGREGSNYDTLLRIMADANSLMLERGSGLTPEPFRIAGIVMMHGHNETAVDLTQLRRSLPIAAATVAGAVARIRTSSNHSITNPSGKLYNMAKISGLGGTLGTALNGKILPISVVDNDEFDVLEFDATGLTGTVVSGSTVAEVGAPCYWFGDLLTEHIDDIRGAAVEVFNTGQDTDDVPVVLVRPDYDPDFEFLTLATGGAGAVALQEAQIALQVIRTSIDRISGQLPKIGVVNIDDGVFKSNAGVLTSQFYFGHDGTFQIGQRIADAIENPSPAAGTTGRPALVVPIIGHSFVAGMSLQAAGYNNDPELISKEGSELDGFYVWNQTDEEIQPVILDPDQFPGTYFGYTNLTSSPVYHPGIFNIASFQLAYLQELRLRFPETDIYILNLGVGGSTAAVHESALPDGDSIESVTVGASSVTIRIANRGSSKPIRRSSTFPVAISGVSGLTPSINSSHVATPTNISTAPTLQGTNEFTIPMVGVTGTPVLSDAKAKFPEVIWDPDANDIWTEFESQTAKFFNALHEAGVRPDCRNAVVVLAENDASIEISTNDFKAAMRRIFDRLMTLYTTRTQPRSEMAIVWPKLIRHGREGGDPAVRTAYEAAQVAVAGEYSNVVLLNVDENQDRLEDAVTISGDNIHPDYKGYVALGFRLAKALDNAPGWDAPRDLSLAGSSTSGATYLGDSVPTGGVSP